MTYSFLFVDQITENDLLSLVGTTSEGQNIDFKKDAYTKQNDKWRTDLCTDISAFANVDGGVIVCGMRENNGLAEDLCGLGEAIDPDRECRRLQQAADNGIEPQIPGLRFEAVKLSDNEKAWAIVIRVPRSFAAPHRIEQSKLFKIRRGNGNDDMSVDELRRSFNLAGMLVENVRAFRKERIQVLADNRQEDIPVILESGVTIVLHVVPLSFSNPGTLIDLSPFNNRDNRQPPTWIYKHEFYYGHFNLDGFVRPRRGNAKPDEDQPGYIQVYRNGVVECVEIYHKQEKKGLQLYLIEDIVLQYFEKACVIQDKSNIEPPLVIMLGLLNAKDYALISGDMFEFADHAPIPLKSNRILLPEILVDTYHTDYKTILKPLFDTLWNIAGRERSSSYDENGQWKRKA